MSVNKLLIGMRRIIARLRTRQVEIIVYVLLASLVLALIAWVIVVAVLYT